MPHRVKEFYFITPINNVFSILQQGILSHNGANKLGIKHSDISMPEVQAKRKLKIIPNGRPLHDYANLYFDARNPMLFKRKNSASEICVLSISLEVLKLPGVVISDQNAVSDYALFMPPDKLSSLNFDRIFAPYWKHPENPIDDWMHSSEKCAEVLIPDSVDPCYIQQAYVYDKTISESLIIHGFDRPIKVNSNLFFR